MPAVSVQVRDSIDLGSFADELTQEFYGATFLAGEHVMATSKKEFVPVVTGNLRNSGRVIPEPPAGNKAVVRLRYGGPAVFYALWVHEAPEHWGQGKAKYLTKAVEAVAPDLPRLFLRWMDDVANQRRSMGIA